MRKAFLLSITLMLGFGGALQAQILTQSPYSRFGIGETFFQGFADQQAMGQTGVAMRNSLNMYLLNPASYSALSKTNFRFGALSYFGTIAQGQQRLHTNGAGVNYLAIGFQVNKKKTWGFSMGAIPYSNIGYNITYQHDSAHGNYTDVLSGNGGISRYYIGTGFSLGKHFSLGLQWSYLHGNVDFSRALEYPAGDSRLNYKESSIEFVHGQLLQGGAQYYFKDKFIYKKGLFNKKHKGEKDTVMLRHQFGATYSVSSQLHNERTFYARNYVLSSGNEYTLDTILLDNSQTANTALPSSLAFGYVLNANDGKWRLALDYTYSQWSAFRSPYESQNLQNSWKAGAGYGFRPSQTADYSKHFARTLFATTEYRFGARYGKTFLNVNNTDITELGISFGLGIPLRMRTVNEEFRYEYVLSSLDISVEYMQRGTLTNNLIKENYWRFAVGVSLNDKWFNKRKIE
ncbi:MAG: hypothetical protein GC180_00885 [Bacteroidetes bacterium]|nr:hypothetical protein [Bacteroidota bacterium]